MVHVEIELEVAMDLVQLSFDLVAVDQGMAATEQLPQRQTPIARQQPSIFAERALDQRLIFNDLFVSRVITENAQPACQTAEHGIGNEARGILSDRGYHVR